MAYTITPKTSRSRLFLFYGYGRSVVLLLDALTCVPTGVLHIAINVVPPYAGQCGTDTVWTGVDVPGAALTNVMLVKLPFASPNEPMIEARIERIRKQGGNPFMAFQVPEAVLKFRQGIGRLIRSKTDRGIVVILDPRVVRKHYGKQFLNAFPPCEMNLI